MCGIVTLIGLAGSAVSHANIYSSADWAPALAGDWAPDYPLSKGQTKLAIAITGEVSGTIFGSPILFGWGHQSDARTCFSAKTADEHGALTYHAACLEGAKLMGQSWPEQDNFIQIWTATRLQ